MITFHKPSENTEKKFFSSLYLMACATTQGRLLLNSTSIHSKLYRIELDFCGPTCGHCYFCGTGS